MVEDRGRLAGLTIRWVARVWSIATVVLVVLFLFGEPFNPRGSQWLGLLLFPLGVCAGMVVAWWREGLGGCITVASLAAFYGLHLVTAGRLPTGWAFLAFAAPGFLFLLSWLVWRRRPATA
jgi:hypothetical protein